MLQPSTLFKFELHCLQNNYTKFSECTRAAICIFPNLIKIRNSVSFIFSSLECRLCKLSLGVHFNCNPATSMITYFINNVNFIMDRSHSIHCIQGEMAMKQLPVWREGCLLTEVFIPYTLTKTCQEPQCESEWGWW